MNRSLMFSPVVARSRLIAIASSRAMTMRSCAMPSTSQICPRDFGSRAIAAPTMPTPTTTTMIARSMAHRNQPRRAAVAASAWRGGAASDSDDSGSDQHPVGRIEIITGPMFSGKSTELLRRAAEHEAAGRRVALVSSSKDTRYGVSSVVTHAGVARRCISVSRLSDLRAAIEKSSRVEESGGGALVEGAAATAATESTTTTTAAARATAAAAAAPPLPPLLPSLDSYDVIAIDEAQFFDDLVPFATAMADGTGGGGGGGTGENEERKSPQLRRRAFTLLVAGLDGDSARGAFGGVLQLVPHAEEVTRLAAECAFCGADAHFSVRLSGSMSSSSSSSSSSSPSSSQEQQQQQQQPGAARVPAPTLRNSPSSSSSSSSPSSSQQQVQVGGAEAYAPACRRHYLQHSSSKSESGSSTSESSGKVLAERQ